MADQAPEFKAEDATAFLTEHGVDAKSLEGVAPEALKSQYESARTIAGKASERALAKADADRKAAVPAEYKFDAGKDAEGKPLTADAGLAKEVSEFAKAQGFTPEQAQKAFEAAGNIRQGALKSLGEEVKQLHANWAQQAEAHKEYGGEKFKENMTVAKAGMEALFNEGARKILADSGLENNPDFIAAMFAHGKTVKSTSTDSGGRSSGVPADARTSFYPNSKMNA